MKTICTYALLYISCLVANGQVTQDYVPIDSVQFDWNERDCERHNKRIVAKCNKLASRVEKTTTASLLKFMSLEDALLEKMCIINERQAETLINGSHYSYRRLEGKLQRDKNQPLNAYSPELDSVIITLKYINSKGKGCDGQTTEAAIRNVKAELKRSELVGQYIQERNAFLRKLAGENPALNVSILPLNKMEYYFNAQVNEYFKLFQLRSNPENALMALLGKMPDFQNYANMNGMLAHMNSQTKAGSGQSMSAVMAELTEAAKAQGKKVDNLLNPVNLFGGAKNPPNNQTSPAELKKLVTTLNQDVVVSTDELKLMDTSEAGITKPETLPDTGVQKETEINDWDPNPLKTKRFVDRLVYGCNLQAGPRTALFPTSGTLSAQVSYQLTTKMNLGTGVSHILGFYRNESHDGAINQIRMGTNGYNIRGFFDFEIHRNLFLQTNYEWSNRKSSLGEPLQPLLPLSNGTMQASWLAGLKIKKPATKRTRQTIEILYDFMHDRTGQPALVVRMGMEFLPRNGYIK